MEFISQSKMSYDSSNFEETEETEETENPSLRSTLTPIREINFDEYVGPLPESNKVFDGLYAGAFPGDSNDTANNHNLITLLNKGVTTFVCMQQEYNAALPRFVWSYTGRRPYFKDVQYILENKEKYSALNAELNVNDVKFLHFPIEDLKTVSDEKTLEAAQTVVQCLKNGEKVYLHCWGGHGRTGIIVCLVLHLMFQLNAVDALEYCEHVHKQRIVRLDVTSPQTTVQKEQVTRIITLLENEDSVSK